MLPSLARFLLPQSELHLRSVEFTGEENLVERERPHAAGIIIFCQNFRDRYLGLKPTIVRGYSWTASTAFFPSPPRSSSWRPPTSRTIIGRPRYPNDTWKNGNFCFSGLYFWDRVSAFRTQARKLCRENCQKWCSWSVNDSHLFSCC